MNIYDEFDPKNPDSFTSKYTNLKKHFDWQKIEKGYSYCKLKEGYSKFIERYAYIANLSIQYFDAIPKEKKHDNRLFFDLSCFYASEIQNLYLNRINNRLNQIRAEWSIFAGGLSVALAIVAIILTFTLQSPSSQQNRDSNSQFIENINIFKKHSLQIEEVEPVLKDVAVCEME